jgi:hypothetical protein
MPGRSRRRAVASLALAALLAAAGCTGDDGGAGASTTATEPASTASPDATYAVVQGTPLAVAAIPDAVAAVEAARGGPQEYTEINVTPEVVNIFVAVEGDQEVAYVVPAGGEPEPPADPVARVGPAFTLEEVDLDAPVRLVQDVQDRFPGGVVNRVALVELPDEGLVWAVQHRSALGGLFNTFYSPDGRLLGGGPVA